MSNYHPGDTQPLSDRNMRDHVRLITDPAYQGAYHAPRRESDAVVIHDIAQADAELTCRLDAIGHTVCELDRADLKALLQLATCDRTALLSERRQYVIARRGDQSRFNELIRTLDTKIEAATKLTDKLARLYAVKS